MSERPDLLGAPPARGGRLTRLDEPEPVEAVQWPDGLVEACRGEAAHWSGGGWCVAGLHGSRSGTHIECGSRPADVRRLASAHECN